MDHDETKLRPPYENSPIQEVICEVHFAVDTPFDEAGVARMRPVWEAQYPDQRVVEAQHLQLHLGLDGISAKATLAGHELIARSDDGRDLAQLGPRYSRRRCGRIWWALFNSPVFLPNRWRAPP